MKKIKQQRCPECTLLGNIIEINVVRDIFNSPREIKTRWICNQCGYTFEKHTPYLEVRQL